MDEALWRSHEPLTGFPHFVVLFKIWPTDESDTAEVKRLCESPISIA
jgi:hypothetical protein